MYIYSWKGHNSANLVVFEWFSFFYMFFLNCIMGLYNMIVVWSKIKSKIWQKNLVKKTDVSHVFGCYLGPWAVQKAAGDSWEQFPPSLVQIRVRCLSYEQKIKLRQVQDYFETANNRPRGLVISPARTIISRLKVICPLHCKATGRNFFLFCSSFL